MKAFYRVIWVVMMCLFATASSVAQEQSLDDVCNNVLQLCQKGEVTSAFHMAMGSLRDAQLIYGKEHPRTAQCMVMVADVAKHREKYYLAGVLYRRALQIQEKALGPKHPDVVRCKLALTDLRENHGQ